MRLPRLPGSRLPPLRRLRTSTPTQFRATIVAAARSAVVWLPWACALLVLQAFWEPLGLPLVRVPARFSGAGASRTLVIGPWLLAWTVQFALASATVRPALAGQPVRFGASSLRALRALAYVVVPAAALALLPFVPSHLVASLDPPEGVEVVVGIVVTIVGFSIAGALLVAPVAAAWGRRGPLSALREAIQVSRGRRKPIVIQIVAWMALALPMGAVIKSLRVFLRDADLLVVGTVLRLPALVVTGLLAYAAAVIYAALRPEPASAEVDDLGEVFA